MKKIEKRRELTFLDPPENKSKVRMYFYAALVVLLILDFFVPKHGHLPWEMAHEFFGVYGFLSCVVLIFVAKILRLIVKRDEDYYEKKER